MKKQAHIAFFFLISSPASSTKKIIRIFQRCMMESNPQKSFPVSCLILEAVSYFIHIISHIIWTQMSLMGTATYTKREILTA